MTTRALALGATTGGAIRRRRGGNATARVSAASRAPRHAEARSAAAAHAALARTAGRATATAVGATTGAVASRIASPRSVPPRVGPIRGPSRTAATRRRRCSGRPPSWLRTVATWPTARPPGTPRCSATSRRCRPRWSLPQQRCALGKPRATMLLHRWPPSRPPRRRRPRRTQAGRSGARRRERSSWSANPLLCYRRSCAACRKRP